MSIFQLEALRARHGDCLILHYGPADKPELILIDGGPSKVYREFLKPRLEELRQERGLGERDSLEFRMLMVSHIDDDHIRGVLEMLEDEREAVLDQRPARYRFRTLWHNSFDDLLGNGAEELRTAATASFQSLGDIAERPKAALAAAFGGHGDSSHGPCGEAVAASVPQGRLCRRLARALGMPLNQGRPRPQVGAAEVGTGAQATEGLLVSRAGQPDIDFGHSLRLKILGPPAKRVERLRTIWDRELERRGLAIAPEQGEDAVEPAALVDRSVFNLASLVVLAEMQGKTLLLAGDARGDDILEGFAEAGLLDPEGDDAFRLDLLKLPHHGSDRNVNVELFRRLPADHYVISGDGRFGNPEPETFRMLFEARQHDGRPFTLHLTYPLDELHPKYPVAELEEVLSTARSDGLQFTLEVGKINIRLLG